MLIRTNPSNNNNNAENHPLTPNSHPPFHFQTALIINHLQRFQNDPTALPTLPSTPRTSLSANPILHRPHRDMNPQSNPIEKETINTNPSSNHSPHHVNRQLGRP